MQDRYAPDPSRLIALIEKHGPAHGVVDVAEPQQYRVPVARVRRKRRRLASGDASGMLDVSLVERDGVLLWVFSDELGLAGWRSGSRRGRRGRAGAVTGVEGEVLKEVSVPLLEPNEYLQALAETDVRLNPALADLKKTETVEADGEKRKRDQWEWEKGLRVVRPQGSGFSCGEPARGSESKSGDRTLLLVHGTFSSSANTLGEYAATEHGSAFLSEKLAQYDRVLAFDHPTLSVSPFLNAVDLARAMAGTKGRLDVIAHSRGGLVVRWWLDGLGASLATDEVRAVLVGSPLNGTSLAAPNRIQPVISLLSNIGSFVSNTLKVAAAANPFALASVALLKFLVRREANRLGLPPIDDLDDRPQLDAAVAVIPGLQGQSAVANNYELDRLRRSAIAKNLKYYAVTANFEPERMGWKLWKVISEFGTRGGDAVADKIFPKQNDLVVDTAHMTMLGGAGRFEKVLNFDSQSEVHHCSYFRHETTIEKLTEWLK